MLTKLSDPQLRFVGRILHRRIERRNRRGRLPPTAFRGGRMLASVSLLRAASAGALLAFLTGCVGAIAPPAAVPLAAGSQSASAALRASSQTGLDVDGSAQTTGLLYVADYTNEAIHIYPLKGKNQQEIGLIQGVPVVEFLNVDRRHNLYVVEFSAGKVLVYPRGATAPSLTLTVEPKGAFPNAVAISRAGEVAVGQFQTTGIEFFKKGATSPFKTIPPAYGSAGFCAYDAAGNLYAILSSASGPSHIGEIVGGGSGTRMVDLGVNTGITNAKGIQVDTQGSVAVVGDSGTLNRYQAGTNTLLGTSQLLDPPSDGPNPNGGFSLLASGKNLYVASALLNAQNLGEALEYAYPAGGAIRNTVTVQIPPGGGQQTAVTGVAVDPPERP
jgi:hypothetical protein